MIRPRMLALVAWRDLRRVLAGRRLGFIGLAVGSLWNANIVDKCRKMKKEWRALRGARSGAGDMEEGAYRPMAAAPQGGGMDFGAPASGGCADGN